MTSRAEPGVPPLFNGVTRAGQHPSGSPTNPPPPKYAARREAGLLIERDIAVRLRDGVRIYVDIYRLMVRPAKRSAVIIGWGPYGKHTVGRTYSRIRRQAGMGVEVHRFRRRESALLVSRLPSVS
jgi:predicted acyl esterase